MKDYDAHSPAMQEALQLLRDDKVASAQTILEKSLKETEQSHGKASFEAAMALNELGILFLMIGDPATALPYLQRAVARDPGDDDGKKKAWLSMRLNLAITLEQAGKFVEAEQMFLDGIERRAAFYGRDHAGYAYGLRPYAEFLVRRGQPGRAWPIINQIIENFSRNEQPEIFALFALRSRVAILGGEEHPFAGAAGLADEGLELIAQALEQQTDLFEPGVILGSAESLLAVAGDRLKGNSRGRIAAHKVAVDAARKAKNHAAERRHLEALLAIFQQQGDTNNIQNLTMALSLAAEHAGDPGEAERLLNEGVRLASAIENPLARIHALRQMGVFYSHHDRAEAEAVLRGALQEAVTVGNKAEIAVTRVALGVFLQHRKRQEEAAELLASAIADLEPSHPDAFVARGHLDAIQKNTGCGCGGGTSGLAQTLDALVRAEIPDGLLDEIELKADGNLGVHLLRQPTEEEAAAIDRAIRQALFKIRMANRG